MSSPPLRPESDFSRAVFKLIRPHIPRERWPGDSLLGRFEVAGDGLWLKADFDGLPPAYAQLAAQLIRDAGVELVLQSPASTAASSVAKCKRWRDVWLFAFLPLLFAIPLMASLSESAMRMAGMLFTLDLVALIFFQALLSHARGRMAAERFIAHIPSPGLKIRLGGVAEALTGPESMPEV